MASMSQSQLGPSRNDGQNWVTSLWSCCSPVGLCCMTCWLPCITYGKTDHRLRNNGNLEGYSCCNSACMIFCLASYCSVACIPAFMQRSNLREKYSLQGNCCKDFMASWCCTCCVLMQSDKEAELREAQAQQHYLRTQQYQPNNVGMVYQPQPQPQAAGVTGIAPVPMPMTEPAPVHSGPYSEK
ncbi:hypothetical protein NLU13_6977 [Sarocladium strictum]|uniref:PLAC8 family-domain-containing protein n=1 Tax=Sarocladium strictum TaxID=5046 RepID=A0AA39GEE5_SARSR|nr:hypothetical protein NLU13_6977 [Sarocladium strictum]